MPFRVSRRNQLHFVSIVPILSSKLCQVAARCEYTRSIDAVVRSLEEECHHGSALCWIGSGGTPSPPSPGPPPARRLCAPTAV